jgi:hypothetical protein
VSLTNAQTSIFLGHIDFHETGFTPAVTSHERSSDIPRGPHPRKSDSSPWLDRHTVTKIIIGLIDGAGLNATNLHASPHLGIYLVV